jgi:hypothetical protein
MVADIAVNTTRRAGGQNMRIATFVTAACMVLLGTVALAQSVTYDFDRGVNFNKYRTYAWVSGTNLPDALNHRRIVNAIDAQLAARGLTKVESSASPDALVAYHASLDTNVRINAFGSGWGGYRFGAMRSATATVEEIPIGTLVIDIVDAESKNVVWRGSATKELDSYANAEKREKNINRAAQKLFRNYPPKH